MIFSATLLFMKFTLTKLAIHKLRLRINFATVPAMSFGIIMFFAPMSMNIFRNKVV
jgi:hypothetical protein